MMTAKVTNARTTPGVASSLKLLGIDIPELAFALPGQTVAISTGAPEWSAFLERPFAGWRCAHAVLGRALVRHLERACGPGAAANHHGHAVQAQSGLDALLAVQGLTCIGDTYRERLLRAGRATPYFIWPNVQPFKVPRLVDAVPDPAALAEIAQHGRLGEQRRCVADARASGSGMFGADPLRLYAFELRFVARRRAPEWWVIDLAAGDGRLHPPVDYHVIQRVEDRLYVPEQYVDLFVSRGWRV